MIIIDSANLDFSSLHLFKDLAIAIPAIAATPTPTAIHVSVSSVFSASFRCF
jgi:hypothetical protein